MIYPKEKVDHENKWGNSVYEYYYNTPANMETNFLPWYLLNFIDWQDRFDFILFYRSQ